MPPSLPTSLKDPSTIFYQSNGVKRTVIASYWIVILLSVPLWWYTTSIQRLALPQTRISVQAQRLLKVPVDVCLENQSVVSELRDKLVERVVDDPNKWEHIEPRFHGRERCPAFPSYQIRNGPKPLVRENELYLPLYDKSKLSSTSDILQDLINPTQENSNRVVQFSPQYRLAFTLLNEDASSGSSAFNWDIRRGLAKRIHPLLGKLQPLHNFTIESQVQFHGRLAFNPQPIGDDSYGLTPEDLTVFVNSAEWSLSSSASNDPVLHFVLFIPSAARRPLHILTHGGNISPSTSFILPQWGGIAIYNPPIDEAGRNTILPSSINDQVFHEFSRQLLALLGVPSLPGRVENHPPNSSLSMWQIDTLMRRRALENAKGAQDTLTSIIKLVDQIENMPVKDDVKDDVQGALDALERMFSATSLQDIFQNSAQATTLASRAFFNPGMLALLYFPAEHKYAVYTPLFASAIIPLFVAALRETLAWRKERRNAAVKED
ncbi:hypothetical protein AN958_04333 [Leucoagaricus sp. SymC.cos]|nr:hypothetical protein AN958_04333 [Leucoagaricus sp. SymC.cos]